ncbi:MAG: acyl carrier protein [Paludibacterium sp.]|uniref:acyl carrier protein n=1 Tax=Paludibacterium sp. TaxID=1917523 RepID=UPI0025D57A22|nr:acyl carrier protein [Paludibacterium sp.]MBV8047880.1 acyl carrier protein [Paludibacterium sp.]MBV8649741.1 acyl carrier protein [Paludibacterium sp.]
MLEDIVKSYLIDNKGKDPALFDNPDLLVSELKLDSLDMVEMLFEIEDRCGFQLPDPMRYAQMHFSAMLADIEQAIREHNNGELPAFDLQATSH